MSINERLKRIITECYNGNKRAFSMAIGVTPTVIENVVGSRQGKPSFDVLEKICANANISPEWLLTGKGDMLLSSSPNTSSCKDATISMSPNIGMPYYDVDFIGGFTEIFNNQTIAPTCNVLVPGFEKASIWCNVTGHSMEPKINPGDIIALHECTIDDIQFGEIYAVVLDTIRTIKIIRKGSTPDKLRYVPINTPDYEEREFEISRIIRIFEVIGSICKFF